MNYFEEVHDFQKFMLETLLEECNNVGYVISDVDLLNRKACVCNKSGVLDYWHYDNLDKCWK